MTKDLTNRWSQPLAVVMRTFDLMKQFLVFATLAPASGGSAPSRQMVKRPKWFPWLGFTVVVILAIGTIVLAWSAYSLTSHALFLSRYGIQKSANVLKFRSVSGTPKGGYTFYYLIDVEGAVREHGFPTRLREGSSVSLLVSPKNPDDIVLGYRGHSPFDVFAHEMGGRTLAYAAAACLVLFPVCLVVTIHSLWRSHQRGGGLFRPPQGSTI